MGDDVKIPKTVNEMVNGLIGRISGTETKKPSGKAEGTTTDRSGFCSVDRASGAIKCDAKAEHLARSIVARAAKGIILPWQAAEAAMWIVDRFKKSPQSPEAADAMAQVFERVKDVMFG